MGTKETPVFCFGIIADIQYADVEDGYNYTKTNKRFYRGALDRLREAIEFWERDKQYHPNFILQLGDIIDGVNKRHGISESSLRSVMNVFSQLTIPVYHIWGNHEFYNFNRTFLLNSKIFSGKEKYASGEEGKTYFSAIPHPKLRVIGLDCYEISLIGSPEGSEHYEMAEKILEVNTNNDKNSSIGLEGLERRFVKYNGGISSEQLDWLKNQLEEARNMQQNVIVMGHCSVFVDAADHSCLCWNAPDILSLFHDYQDTVVCYLAGHDHQGGRARDSAGIQHLTFPGVLENDQAPDFGTVYVYQNRMEMVGNGRVEDIVMPLRYTL